MSTTKNPGSGASNGFDAEHTCVDDRRKKCREPKGPARRPEYGLALSGGGIRSATFALGVIRGLAKQRSFRLFDYMSTVSGGGYVGAAIGRLICSTGDAEKAESCMADDRSMFLWWLRHNGRYLIPAGAQDEWMAGASALRGWMVSQFSLMLLIFAAVVIVALPHSSVWFAQTRIMAGECSQWLPSAWLIAVPLPAFICMGLIWAHCFLVLRITGALLWALAVAIMGGVAFAMTGGFAEAYYWCGAGVAFLAGCAVAFIAASAGLGWLIFCCLGIQRWIHRTKTSTNDPNPIAMQRLALTGLLKQALFVLVFTLCAAVMDATTWWVFTIWTASNSPFVTSLNAISAAVVLLLVAARAILPSLQGNSGPSWMRNVDWLAVAHVLGWVTVALLAWLALLALTFVLYLGTRHPASALEVLGLVLLGIAVFVAGTGRQIESTNLSSLHYLYRARLARAYTSVGNHNRFPQQINCEADRQATNQLRRVDEALPGDDIPYPDYVPHESGGPLHLINCCVNQTRDDRTGTYNADRRGVALVVGPRGVETGGEPPADNPRLGRTSLAEWTAVSGAAVSSGMGFYTRSGVALLLYMSGLRLGYWVSINAESGTMSRLSRWAWICIPKYCAVFSEAFGSFPGLRSRFWYASDGGHFENSGVYALLKRKLQLIVLVDAAADPDYLFGDVENLVRKAKIDLTATIEFLDPSTFPAHGGVSPAWFATPYSMTASAGPAFLLLARIGYCDGSRGTLLIVKPRRTDSMPLDVVGYADRNPVFPQESTAHQLFSEQQWESYHALGVEFGYALTPNFLATLPSVCEQARVLPLMPSAAGVPGEVQSLAPLQPSASRRARVQQTVRTSLGVGVSLSALAGLWQTVQSQLHAHDTVRDTYYTTLRKLATEVEQDCVEPVSLKLSIAELDRASTALGSTDEARVQTANILQLATRFCDNPDVTECDLTRQWSRFFDSGSDSRVQQFTPTSWYWNPSRPNQANVPKLEPAASTTIAYRCAIREDQYMDGTKIHRATLISQGTMFAPGNGEPNQMALTASKIDLSTSVVKSTSANASLAGKNVTPIAPAPAPSDAGKSASAAPKGKPEALKQTSANLDQDLAKSCDPSALGRKLYAQIYSEDDRNKESLGALKKAAEKSRVRWMGIENVQATADRRGTRAPFRWPRPTFLYVDERDENCARALAAKYEDVSHAMPGTIGVRSIPPNLDGIPGNIEFWLPPAPADQKATSNPQAPEPA